MQSALTVETGLAACARLGRTGPLTTPALLSKTLACGLASALCACSLPLLPPLPNASTCEIAQLLADPLGEEFLSCFVTFGVGICLGKRRHQSVSQQVRHLQTNWA